MTFWPLVQWRENTHFFSRMYIEGVNLAVVVHKGGLWPALRFHKSSFRLYIHLKTGNSSRVKEIYLTFFAKKYSIKI